MTHCSGLDARRLVNVIGKRYIFSPSSFPILGNFAPVAAWCECSA